MDDLQAIEKSALERSALLENSQDIAQLRSEILGKKGQLGLMLRSLGKLPPAERKDAGGAINKVKGRIEKALNGAQEAISTREREQELARSRVDISLPGRRHRKGMAHPLRIVEEAIIDALVPLGFSVAEGPVIEHDWYNFEALNIPQDHPSRDMQDTFFIAPHVVLRTHTSNVQVRTMLQQKPPVRILAPGMVFRHDDVDASHSPVFHQIEGLWVDDHTTFADLKGVLHHLIVRLFGSDANVRFRPSFFPFTEPSVEVDVSCVVCGGKGGSCKVCKGSGWIEILGAGMVDPAVFESVGYDPSGVQGFAFGAGLERIAMLKWGVDDIRLFYENDQRFLSQFAPRPSF